MKVKQFNDKALAHYSYAIVSEGEMALIDPSRDPFPYYEYAEQQQARIVAVFETHPHADFVSSHLQVHQETEARIYVSQNLGAEYPHMAFDEGSRMKLGKTFLHALNTPGHSPDSICIIAEEGEDIVLFSGDTLFIGDVGRPDLREQVGNLRAKRVELAKMMYHTIHNKFSDLPGDTIVYPAHGAGSLCGKNMSTAASSTLEQERRHNWAFQVEKEEDFVEEITANQPFVPDYFGFNVDLNRRGADPLRKDFRLYFMLSEVPQDVTVVDTRDAASFQKGHLRGSINIMARSEKDKFETWLGAIVKPDEPFLVVVDRVTQAPEIMQRISKIGYERRLKGIATISGTDLQHSEELDLQDFAQRPTSYTILDIRNTSEAAEKVIFDSSIKIPLNELRERLAEVPAEKPVVVHCAGGYRSSAGSSILESVLPVKVFDLGEEIRKYS